MACSSSPQKKTFQGMAAYPPPRKTLSFRILQYFKHLMFWNFGKKSLPIFSSCRIPGNCKKKSFQSKYVVSRYRNFASLKEVVEANIMGVWGILPLLSICESISYFLRDVCVYVYYSSYSIHTYMRWLCCMLECTL